MNLGSTPRLPQQLTKFVKGVPYIVAKSDDSAFWHWIPAIKITTWRPTTHYEVPVETVQSTNLFVPADCRCTINFWWDRRLSEEMRRHEYCSEEDALRLRADLLYRPFFGGGIRHRTIKSFRWQEETCEIHRGLAGRQWFETLLEENRMRNADLARVARTVARKHEEEEQGALAALVGR